MRECTKISNVRFKLQDTKVGVQQPHPVRSGDNYSEGYGRPSSQRSDEYNSTENQREVENLSEGYQRF